MNKNIFPIAILTTAFAAGILYIDSREGDQRTLTQKILDGLEEGAENIRNAVKPIFSTQTFLSTGSDMINSGFFQAKEKISAKVQPLLDLIGSKESNGNYNVVYGGKSYPLTTYTIQQVLDLQSQLIKSTGFSAAGKYQIIRKTLLAVTNQLKLDPKTTYFNEQTQDLMAVTLLANRGLYDFLEGDKSTNSFAKAIAMEWASFPKDSSNKTYYDDGVNKSLVPFKVVTNTLEEIKTESEA